ncbi:enoyl-CoA hydratase/isomerase family protein [Nocardioides halotolerans]|jgi:enoyl-CoA hydratase|uniref:enoyl-CoA hydratase/isomerase family protein n=1 Tax=Nocardioides halotolerans TaxID=433660 RepID=UPI0003FDC2B2|nr:enoyl-CoA hydratase-related protein [Nocardioides halotolerans]
MSDVVTWHTHSPGIMVVTIERPPANALGLPILDGLTGAMDAATAAGDVKVMVVCSALDGFFAAGADIKHMSSIDRESFSAYGARMRGVFDRLAEAPWISVAAIDGLALGGGMELTLACTMRVAGPGARLGLPEVKLGLIPGSGGTQRLPRIVGRSRALDLMLTARQVSAEEAAAIGLVDRLVDGDALKGGLDLASELVTMSLPALMSVVRSVDVAFDSSLADGNAFEAAEVEALFESGEAAEGISAFLAKRPPNFA